jgi:Fanconi anemia group M protein
MLFSGIGEEGLDIGEVDLIVNYDTLKSPIRMIQRVGRTGRKRSGRVVCLVAEGIEERTMRQSKLSERNLAHALRRPESFLITATTPLLPVTPTLKEKNMHISHSFRMSQVEGDGKKAPGDSSKSAEFRTWKLTDDLEARRAAVMGASNKVAPVVTKGLSHALKRHLLVNRLQRSHECNKRLSSRLGRASLALRMIESAQSNSNKSQPDRKRRRAGNEIDRYLDVYFPLTPNEEGFNAVAWGSAYINTCSDESKNKKLPAAGRLTNPNNGRKLEIAHEECKGLQLPVTNGKTDDQASPLQSRSTPSTSDLGTRAMDHQPCDFVDHAQKDPMDMRNSVAQSMDAENELVLPTPASSSDEESEDEKHVAHTPEKQLHPAETKAEDDLMLPSQESSSDEDDTENYDGPPPVQSNINRPNDKASDKTTTNFRDDCVRTFGNRKASKKRRVLDDSPSVTDASTTCMTEDRSAARQEQNSLDNAERKSRGIFDVSLQVNDSHSNRLSKARSDVGSPSALVDTQNSPKKDNSMSEDVDIVCGVCGSGDSPEEDPIVLCDGPGGGTECEIAVHTSCYSIPKDAIHAEEWRCEVCQYRFDGGLLRPKCFICNGPSGPLNRFLGNEWVHKRCKELADEPISADDDSDENDANRRRRLQRRSAARALRKRRYGNFLTRRLILPQTTKSVTTMWKS